MANLPQDLSNHIEQVYYLEYPKLVDNQYSPYFGTPLLGLIMIFIGMNIDVELNKRYIVILAKCLRDNMSVFDKDQFIQSNNLSSTLVDTLDIEALNAWPEPVDISANTNNVVDLTALRSRLTAQVNYQAGRIAANLITIRPGKEMEYIGTWISARDLKKGLTTPTPEEFPLLALEIGNPDNHGGVISNLEEAADYILEIYKRWENIAAVIKLATQEALRVLDDVEITDPNILLTAAQINWAEKLPYLFPSAPPEPEEPPVENPEPEEP